VVAEWNRSKGMPFRFFTEASINMADDDELLRMMRDAGFASVFIGIETPDEHSLKVAQKLQNTRRDILDCIRHIQSYSMEVMAGFIVGFDSDTDDIFDRQVDFIEKSAIPLAMVGLLQALPNTQLYRRLVAEGRLLQYGDGNSMSTALNFVPKMDAARLVEGYRSILKRIYDHEAYYQRVREFLKRYSPAHRAHLRLMDYVTLGRSMLIQGFLSKGRTAYWKLFFDALLHYPRAFGTAITMAIMGYHFQVMTERICSEATQDNQTHMSSGAQSQPLLPILQRRAAAAQGSIQEYRISESAQASDN
jgi:radical SAM superfamily enzyme YgiQ (UPF0313 family)